MFLPKRSKIFKNFNQQSLKVKEAALAFRKIANNKNSIDQGAMALARIEQEADSLVHKITDDIEIFFILPLDKEDLKVLAESLDDIVDNLEQAGNRLAIYKVKNHNREILRSFADLICQASNQVEKAIRLIEHHDFSKREYYQCYKKLHDIEDKGDKLHRKVLEKLMGRKSNLNPLTVIKWKEIFQTLEETLDMFEDVSILFEKLRIKYR